MRCSTSCAPICSERRRDASRRTSTGRSGLASRAGKACGGDVAGDEDDVVGAEHRWRGRGSRGRSRPSCGHLGGHRVNGSALSRICQGSRRPPFRAAEKAGKGRRAVSIDAAPAGWATTTTALQAFRSRARPRTRTEDTTTVSCTGDPGSLAMPPGTRESRRHAGFRRLRWRDPDSNRGHHDFQAWVLSRPDRSKSLHLCGFWPGEVHGDKFANYDLFSPIWYPDRSQYPKCGRWVRRGDR